MKKNRIKEEEVNLITLRYTLILNSEDKEIEMNCGNMINKGISYEAKEKINKLSKEIGKILARDIKEAIE